MPSDISTSLLTPEMLTLVLTRGTVNMGLADGKLPAIFLSIKYSIIHKIGISNWYPSTHALITSTALAHLICLIGIGSHVDVGQFVFNHPLRNVGVFGIKISICFPHLLCVYSAYIASFYSNEQDFLRPTPKNSHS